MSAEIAVGDTVELPFGKRGEVIRLVCRGRGDCAVVWAPPEAPREIPVTSLRKVAKP